MEANKRTQQKEQSHQRMLEVAARRFREEGLAGAGVQKIMEEAGLTHGGFYSHFASKSELMEAALSKSARAQRDIWLTGVQVLPVEKRLRSLVSRYLSHYHRDAPGAGCLLPALSAEISRAPDSVRETYDTLLRETVTEIEEALGEGGHEEAVGALALCVGGLLLARAAQDPEFSDDILRSCRQFATGRKNGEES